MPEGSVGWPGEPGMGGWYTAAEHTGAVAVMTEMNDWTHAYRRIHQEAFEEAFAGYTGAAHAVAVNSGGVALDLAMACLDGESGDEVVSCAINFPGTHLAVLGAGLRLVLCELDPVTLNLDPTDMAARMTLRTVAVLVTHMNRLSADLGAITRTRRGEGLVGQSVYGHQAAVSGATTRLSGLVQLRSVSVPGRIMPILRSVSEPLGQRSKRAGAPVLGRASVGPARSLGQFSIHQKTSLRLCEDCDDRQASLLGAMVAGPRPLGRRIALLRKARGWTQDGLAMRLNRSPSWVTKVERGVHIIESITTLRQIAGVFNVPVAALIDEPTQVHNPVVEPAAGLVWVLDRPPMMLPAAQPVRSLTQLAREAVALRRVYNRSSTRFLTAARVLPELIIETAILARSDERPRRKAAAHAVLASLYRLGSLEFRHRGSHLHARVALDRAATAAENADAPLLVAAVAATLTNELMIGGYPAEALSLATDAARFVESGPASADAAHVIGALNLYAAQAAARAGAASDAMLLLAAADDLAHIDADRYSLIFGPTNIAVQTAGIHVDLRRPRAALDACTELRVRRLGSVNRLCYFHLHRSRAYGMVSDLDGSRSALISAWRAAPHIVVNDAFGRQQVAVLLDKKRRYDPTLRQIARQMGLL